MSIEPCEGCGNSINTEADKCPYCGADIKKRRVGCLGSFIIVSIVLLYLLLMPSFKTEKTKQIESKAVVSQKTSTPGRPAPQKPTQKNIKKENIKAVAPKAHEIVYNSAWDSSVYQVERYLKKHLKDPGSYDGIEWSKVISVNHDTCRYAVRHKYRAKNSFGGYVIENQLFYLDKEGEVISFTSLE